MDDVNFNQNTKVTIFKTGKDLYDDDLVKIYGEKVLEEIEGMDVLDKKYLDKIGIGFVNDSVDRIVIMCELKRADRL